MFQFALALFQALASIPKVLDFLKEFAGGVTHWYISQSEKKTLTLIQDAAAMSARAHTQEERQAALLKWREALTRPRYEK